MSAYKQHSMPHVQIQRKGPYDGYRPGMPLLNGHYVALEYVPKQHIQKMRNQWRSWCQANPKHTWPFHVTNYIEQLKRENRKSELLELHTD